MATVSTTIDLEKIAELQEVVKKVDEITEIDTFTVKLSDWASVRFNRPPATKKWVVTLTVTQATSFND